MKQNLITCLDCRKLISRLAEVCPNCGRPVSKHPASTKHVFPAILSFFIPTLGQFIKGQVKWGLMIWLWFILGNLLLFALSGIFGSFTIVLVIIYNLSLWIYQIYDAYNSPEKEENKE